jgi:hypothetical protein
MANPAFSNSPAFSERAALKLAAQQAPAIPSAGELQEHYSLPEAHAGPDWSG